MVKVRKGFTLVELLIVIVIIGILAAAMMLSSGSATAAAEASNVISDLRSMKAAALMFYADSQEAISGLPKSKNVVKYLKPYVDNPLKYDANNSQLYQLIITDGKWWVGYSLNLAGKTKDVKEKLQGKAKSTGLLPGMALGGQYSNGSIVYMVAR